MIRSFDDHDDRVAAIARQLIRDLNSGAAAPEDFGLYDTVPARRVRRCRSTYPGSATLGGRPIRCESRSDEPHIHGHSLAARYWED